MSAYEALAPAYDRLTRDVPYPEIADFLERVLRTLARAPEDVLDLACGTGSLSCELAHRGYRVTGADISQEMLTVAADKAFALEGNRPFFICQPMQALELAEPVGLAVCCLDSLNYLPGPAACRETFRRVFENLRPGGVFLFDVNTPAKLRALDGQVFLDEDDAVFCVWRAEFSESENTCYYGLDLFERGAKGLWTRSCEEHAEYAFSPDDLTAWLREAGFSGVRRFGDRTLDAPGPDAERVYFAATKDGNEHER